MLRGLVREAGGVVALEERLGVVDAAGEVGDVDAGEGVDFAGVAADGEAVVGVVSKCWMGWFGFGNGDKRDWEREGLLQFWIFQSCGVEI